MRYPDSQTDFKLFRDFVEMNNHQRSEAIIVLFDAINSRGLDNVTDLAEITGIPLESTRYMIWHEFPKHFISYQVEIDYAALGLRRWMMEFTPLKATSGNKLQNGVLGGGAGVIYSAKVVPENSHLAILAVPFGDQYKLWMEMEDLVKTGVIKNYSLREIRSMRNLSFNPSFYSLRESRWSFTWKDVEKYQHKIKGKSSEVLSDAKTRTDSAIFDYKDLLILREFQKRIPKSISKLVKPLELDHFNIRYHYNHHAKQAILGYRLKVVPERPKELCSFVFLFSRDNGEDDALEMARSVALSLPFTDSEWETEKEYCWAASCPGEYANELLRFTRNKFAQIRGNLRFLTLDSTSEFQGTVPVQFYDEKAHKWSYSPKISSKGPNASFQELKNMCRYEVDRRCLVHETSPQNCTISSCPFVLCRSPFTFSE
jgi:hypothetical protein